MKPTAKLAVSKTKIFYRLPKPLLLAAHHTITGAHTTSMCCPETATTASEFTSTALGAPVLTTETSLLNSQNALFQRVVKPVSSIVM